MAITLMVKSHGYCTSTKMATLRQGGGMNDKLRNVLNCRYKAEIQDALYKIKCYSEQELIIPEHPDITGEVDKLLQKIAEAEDKMAVMELHYDKNVANKSVL